LVRYSATASAMRTAGVGRLSIMRQIYPPFHEAPMTDPEAPRGDPRRTMQHAMNNPLTALMAEIQLLQLEEPAPGVQESCTRMLELVQRLVVLTRRLGDLPEQP